ncbi:DUF2971 domain-containing protein [Arsenicicoccus dermatophilus]
MNDPRETLVGLELARRRLAELPGLEDTAPPKLEGSADDWPNISADREGLYHIACFSAVGDHLSQWRGYASEGWCLEFSTEGILEVLRKHQEGPRSVVAELEPVRYDRASQLELLEEWLDSCQAQMLAAHGYSSPAGASVEAARKHHRQLVLQHARRPATLERTGLRRACHLIKHESWSDEREIRLLAHVPHLAEGHPDPTGARPGCRQVSDPGEPSRFALALEASGAPFPLLRVIAAPGTPQEKKPPILRSLDDRMRIAKQVLAGAGLNSIPLDKSTIPVNGPVVSAPQGEAPEMGHRRLLPRRPHVDTALADLGLPPEQIDGALRAIADVTEKWAEHYNSRRQQAGYKEDRGAHDALTKFSLLLHNDPAR